MMMAAVVRRLLPSPSASLRAAFSTSVAIRAPQQLVPAVRGMKDILPDEAELRQEILWHFGRIACLHGYRPIEPSLVEHTGVFARTLGDGSDVVRKEMYSFPPPRTDNAKDASGEAASLTLRPEGTAGVMRSLLTSGLIRQLPQKLYYSGPMFRHERPQKGRYRQFTQAGIEAIGCDNPLTDVEVISMAHQLLTTVLNGGKLRISLLLNSLGDADTMGAYSAALSDYFSRFKSDLSPDSLSRLERGASLRILDSKAPGDAPIIAGAPQIGKFLTPAAAARFNHVRDGLSWLDVDYSLCPTLVRGLDYYRHTIFEFVVSEKDATTSDNVTSSAVYNAASTSLSGSKQQTQLTGAGQLGTVLAGGRYDGLSAALGGPPGVAGIGWAAGVDRLTMLTHLKAPSPAPKVAVLPVHATASDSSSDGSTDLTASAVDAMIVKTSLAVAAAFRQKGLSAVVLHGGHSAKKQVAVSYTYARNVSLPRLNGFHFEICSLLASLLFM